MGQPPAPSGCSVIPSSTALSVCCGAAGWPAQRGAEMVAADLYLWLKAFHVLMAVTWVGGAITLQILAVKITRSEDRELLRSYTGLVEFVGTRIFTTASLILLALGIWMVIDSPAWDFGQFWVLAAIAMFAFSFVSGAFFLGPQSGKLKEMYDA